MHPDKKREELEQRREFEQEQIEMIIDADEEESVEETENVKTVLPETAEDIAKRKKRELIFELVLFLILGILLGITLKTEAVKKFTIGFDDYQIAKPSASYDVTAFRQRLEDEAARQQKQLEAQQAAPASATQQVK